MSPKHKVSKCNVHYICKKESGLQHISTYQNVNLKSSNDLTNMQPALPTTISQHQALTNSNNYQQNQNNQALNNPDDTVPLRHTTSFQHRYDVVRCRTTSCVYSVSF